MRTAPPWTSTLIAATLLALLSACAEEPVVERKPPAVQFEPAASEALPDRILTSAVLEAETWQPLYFQQSGVAASVAVQEGDTVTAGQRLSNLDLTYQQNQVAITQLQVRTAEVDLAQAEHELSQARAVAEAGGYSPEQVYDKEQSKLEAELNLQRQRLNLQSQVIKLNQMMLHAPFDGLVSEVNVRVGEKVQGDVTDPDNDSNQRPPMAIYQPGAFTMRVSLPEGQARRLRIGDPAEVGLMEDPEVHFAGTIDWIAPAVDRDNRTVAVRISARLTEADPFFSRVRDGSTARVEVLAQAGGQVLTVPEKSILYHQDRAYLFVTDGETVEKIAVTQGLVRSGRVEIRDGIDPGDKVVTSQVYALTDGQTVRVSGAGQ